MENSQIEILKLNEDNWQDYKNLRLEALQSDPQAFGASYADAIKKPDDEWIERVKAAQNEDKDIMLFAKTDGQLIGMIGAYFNKEINKPNVADIWGVYVNSQYRGRSIGKKLMQELLNRLGTVPNLRRVKLMVNKNQTSAVGLYQSLGFEVTGNESTVLGDGNKYDEYIMERELRADSEMIIKKFLVAGGNSTMLVWNCPEDKRLELAKKLLDEVEQVGFVSEENGIPRLRMMGNELCINATVALASEKPKGTLFTSGLTSQVNYSNAEETSIELDLPYKRIDNIVLFEGIGYLCTNKEIEVTKELLSDLARKYNLPAFGVILYNNEKIKPYVYVAETNSLFQETACGSGSIATSIVTGYEKIVQPTGNTISVKRVADKVVVTAKVTQIK